MGTLSIGEFAQASGLTPKALRLYDDLGLLAPAEVDPRSGYRSYEPEQLERARLVASLRRLGMPLARIRVVCDLPPRAAAAEVTSYWRQVEADTAARRRLSTLLIDRLSGKDAEMTVSNSALGRRHAARTERGLVRQSNEDVVFTGTRLCAVADGFGTQGADHTAGAAAVEALAPVDSRDVDGDLLEALGEAAGHARTAVAEFAAADAARQNAGSTLTAMLWSGSRYALVHVGDSRAYLLRAGELTQLTHDHTFVQSLVDEGRMSPEEAASHPQRAALLRALQSDGTGEPDLHLREAHPGDRYLLCSDGLHQVLPETQLHRVLDQATTPEDTVDRFADLVTKAGAPDNFACVVTHVS